MEQPVKSKRYLFMGNTEHFHMMSGQPCWCYSEIYLLFKCSFVLSKKEVERELFFLLIFRLKH